MDLVMVIKVGIPLKHHLTDPLYQQLYGLLLEPLHYYTITTQLS
jgi:hypothetical protein